MAPLAATPPHHPARARRGRPRRAALCLLLAGGACATPAIVPRIQAAHPGASYEATARGCGTGEVSSRRFGANLRLALLWSRQAVRSPRRLPCEVTVEAVAGPTRQPVYRAAQTSMSSGVTEGPVPP